MSSPYIRLRAIVRGETRGALSLEAFTEHVSGRRSALNQLAFLRWYQAYTEQFFLLPVEEALKSPPPPPGGYGAGEMESPPRSMAQVGQMGHVSQTEKGCLSLEADVPAEKQPLRSDVDRALLHFLMPKAEYSVRVPKHVRDATWTAASRTTHPAAFIEMVQHVEHQMRALLPSFEGKAARNMCTRSRRIRYTVFSLVGLVCIAQLLVVWALPNSRLYRLTAILPSVVAISYGVSARYGVCALLTHRGAQEVNGWTEAVEDPWVRQAQRRIVWHMLVWILCTLAIVWPVIMLIPNRI
jgi:hypothetical protein